MFHILYEEYRYGHRFAAMHYRHTRIFGMMPVALVGLMTYIHGASAGPGLWCALGLTLAFQMIVWSVYNLHRYEAGRSRWASRLVANSDRWYPGTLVVVQNTFIAITVFILWFTVCEMGFPCYVSQHALLLLVLILFPMRRLTLMKAPSQRTHTHELWDEILYYLSIIGITLFLALLITAFVMPPDQPLTSALSPLLIILWVIVMLIVLSCVVLFLDHMIRKRPAARAARAAQEPGPAGARP